LDFEAVSPERIVVVSPAILHVLAWCNVTDEMVAAMARYVDALELYDEIANDDNINVRFKEFYAQRHLARCVAYLERLMASVSNQSSVSAESLIAMRVARSMLNKTSSIDRLLACDEEVNRMSVGPMYNERR
jgi:hypothetical protein